MTQHAGLLGLAEDVQRQTKAIVDYLQQNKLPEPSFAPDSAGPPETPEYNDLHSKLKQSLENLHYLVEGPTRHWRTRCCEGYELAALQVALDFNLFTLVPAKGRISLDELSKSAGLDADRTQRIVRLLAMEFIFREPEPGFVEHTPSSYLLNQDGDIRATVHYTMDEMLRAASSTAENVKASPLEYNSAVTPFTTRHGLPIYDFYTQDPERALRFARAMAGWSKMNLNTTALESCFHWEKLNGTVVDVGGGSGRVSIALAERFPNLNFIVQDSADMHAAGQRLLTDTTRSRVQFMQHSFFDPQPIGEVAAFMMRNVALNWCDADVAAMFRALVPGLERSAPGTPLIINDLVMPAYDAQSREVERGLRQIDIIMLVCFGGKLRTRKEFEALLKLADSRFEVKNYSTEGLMGLYEVYLRL